MDILSKQDLMDLISQSGERCVSIYMPTHRVGNEVQQDPIRFRNLMNEARDHLVSTGVCGSDLCELLGPAEKLVSNGQFWQHQGAGLALFLAEDRLRYYRLPIGFEPFVLVADRYHIVPLLRALSENGKFYVLALSQEKISLYQCSAYSVAPIDLDQAPEGLGEALAYDDPEKQLQFHTSTRQSGGIGERPATFHGHGVGVDHQKVDILRYFRQVDQAVYSQLCEEHAPLVLAGVEYLLPIYREANTYPHLMDMGIEGSPETLGEGEMHRQARRIVTPVLDAEQREAIGRYQALAGTGDERTSSDPGKVVLAACRGRVEMLFVVVGDPLWGALDAGANAVEFHQEKHAGDHDLANDAAIHTLLNDGTVYALDPKEMPSRGTVAAVLRY